MKFLSIILVPLLFISCNLQAQRGKIKTYMFPDEIECLLVEIRLRNNKYILIAGYCPHKELSSSFLSHVGRALDKMLGKYENILIIGDFNSTQNELCMRDFCETYSLENLIKEPTCYKNPKNPSSIDVMLTNTPNSFQNELDDLQRQMVTIL